MSSTHRHASHVGQARTIRLATRISRMDVIRRGVSRRNRSFPYRQSRPNISRLFASCDLAWNTQIESGGHVVDPWTPYGSESMADDLGPIIGTRDRVAIARFHREVSTVHSCAA